MAVFTFICRQSGGSWSAKQRGGDLEGSAANTTELQKEMRNLALQTAGSGSVSIDFSLVTPSAAVLQVIVGGGGGGGAVFASGGGGGGAPAAAAPPAEEEKKEEVKEESEDDMGFSLFD